MIISIRFISTNWHWEIYTIGKEISHGTGKYAHGISPTWKEMISLIEIQVSSLEKKNET
jgi:hypothetical protein